LAGGKATRMGGVAKHLLRVGGETIFERQVRALAPLVDEIIVSGPAIAGYRNVVDDVSDIGPLAGVAAGLAACTTPWLLVIAGDMPNVSHELIAAMLARRAPDLDAIGIRMHPLLCVLHTRTRETVERRIAAGKRKASGLLTDEGLRVAWVEDVEPNLLASINTPGDLAEH
jgi:molybdopterin-guanine dinucleotide biosynthesis protein A